MIDHIALAIGHGLLGLALVRLVMRADLNDDPLLGGLREASRKHQLERRGAHNKRARRSREDG
ncbi:MAG: hypothetical protein V2I27_04655 [Erythrobacter sp.]|jgi:hypothetical protein|nr:hypothetical protein [Erythrobacter sp.]